MPSQLALFVSARADIGTTVPTFGTRDPKDARGQDLAPLPAPLCRCPTPITYLDGRERRCVKCGRGDQDFAAIAAKNDESRAPTRPSSLSNPLEKEVAEG